MFAARLLLLGPKFCRIGFEPRSSFAASVGLNWGTVAVDGRPFLLPLPISHLLVIGDL